jgi:uncharacterized 2Fe-2S/4Fe-4S cluster protein (DUF4445 family)
MTTLTLSPSGRRLTVADGTSLQDVLFVEGIEFPCGGRGRCNGCRVRVLKGRLDVTEEEAKVLRRVELAAGWRLACRHKIKGDLELELAQWEMPVLSDGSTFAFAPQTGLGVAIDLGTTTLAVQLLDLRTGHVLASETALNAQTRHGVDILSRVEVAVRGAQPELERLIRVQLGTIVGRLLASAPHSEPPVRIVLAGNTVMHHLFCGIDATPLATHPFKPAHPGRVRLSPGDLLWDIPDETVVEFLPCIGGLVGADILAGIVATGLDKREGLAALIDLGTNGEVVVGGRDRLVCTSTAAGPAFEGARIAMGMRAATGAISEVRVSDLSIRCRVIGGGAPRGLCGSGLVDAVAAGLELGTIRPDGRLAAPMPLAMPVELMPQDVRELQLAKGAIAAGLRILTARLGASLDDIETLYLAGAFGNTINPPSAQRIGLLRLPAERIVPAGNTALLGAKRALFEDAAVWDALARRVEHVALDEDAAFESVFAEEMEFPD